MFKSLFRRSVSIPLGAIAVLGGALIGLQALADFTPGAYLDAQTFIVVPRMRRLNASSVTCAGLCRTAQAGGANQHFCVLNELDQVSFAACLTTLNTDCTPQAVINCASGERQ